VREAPTCPVRSPWPGLVSTPSGVSESTDSTALRAPYSAPETGSASADISMSMNVVSRCRSRSQPVSRQRGSPRCLRSDLLVVSRRCQPSASTASVQSGAGSRRRAVRSRSVRPTRHRTRLADDRVERTYPVDLYDHSPRRPAGRPACSGSLRSPRPEPHSIDLAEPQRS
jgi:hypothetical protein